MTEEEKKLMLVRMEKLGYKNIGQFIRQSVLNGQTVVIQSCSSDEIVTQLKRLSNNVNQIAKRLNQGGNAYREDSRAILEGMEQLWSAMNARLDYDKRLMLNQIKLKSSVDTKWQRRE